MTDLRPEREHIPQQSQRQILVRFALQWYSKRKRCSIVEVLLGPRLRLLLELMPHDVPDWAAFCSGRPAPAPAPGPVAAAVRLHSHRAVVRRLLPPRWPRVDFFAACCAALRGSFGQGCRSGQLASLHCELWLYEAGAVGSLPSCIASLVWARLSQLAAFCTALRISVGRGCRSPVGPVWGQRAATVGYRLAGRHGFVSPHFGGRSWNLE